MRAGEERLGRRDDDGDAGSDVLAFDQRRVTDPDPGYVGDRILRPGREPADFDPEVACAGLHAASLTADDDRSFHPLLAMAVDGTVELVLARLEIDGERCRPPAVDLIRLLLDPLSLDLERVRGPGRR